MHTPQSLVIILLALALAVVTPYLSGAGIVQAASRIGQPGQNGNADSTSQAFGGRGGLDNTPNGPNVLIGNGGQGGSATDHSTANGGNGGSNNVGNGLNSNRFAEVFAGNGGRGGT